jgi:hypothetical protein
LVFIEKSNQIKIKKTKPVQTNRFWFGFLKQKPVQIDLPWFFSGLARFFSVWARFGLVFSASGL